jgi:hypothetical protein
MNYAVEMGPGTMIYVPNFIKIGSGIQTLMGGGDSQKHRQHGDRISLLLFFQNKESRLKRVKCIFQQPNNCRNRITSKSLKR